MIVQSEICDCHEDHDFDSGAPEDQKVETSNQPTGKMGPEMKVVPSSSPKLDCAFLNPLGSC